MALFLITILVPKSTTSSDSTNLGLRPSATTTRFMCSGLLTIPTTSSGSSKACSDTFFGRKQKLKSSAWFSLTVSLYLLPLVLSAPGVGEAAAFSLSSATSGHSS